MKGPWSWQASDYGFRFDSQSEACMCVCVCVRSWLCVSHAFWMSFLIWGQSSLQSGSTFSVYISGLSLTCNPEGMGFLFSIGNTEDSQQSEKKIQKLSKEQRRRKTKNPEPNKIKLFSKIFKKNKKGRSKGKTLQYTFFKNPVASQICFSKTWLWRYVLFLLSHVNTVCIELQPNRFIEFKYISVHAGRWHVALMFSIHILKIELQQS